MIGGFIVGNAQIRVLIRAIGPSLGIAGALANRFLELHDSNGTLQSNDDWRDAQDRKMGPTGGPPASNKKSAIISTLAPANYTAIVRGADNGTGVALVEVYDLE